MFCSIASGFVPVEHYDFRTPDFKLDGIQCGVQNLQALTFPSDSINSLSCMHVIEHIGLGRYGDKINPRGDIQAAKELIRVLAPGGRLIIALPLAQKASIRFNAHRIYDYSRVLELFNTLDLTEFSFLSDLNGYKFFRHASLADVEGSSYGCGCFVFQKRLTCVK
jgi:SAM-dependent methyltransferase